METKTKTIFLNKNYLLLLIGQLVSNLGNAVHSTGVIWFIMSSVEARNSGLLIAIFSLCSLIPSIIFGPISGVFVDKYDRKKIIVGTDIIRGVLILSLAIFTFYNIIPIILLYIITVFSAFVGTFFNPAVDASVPNIVSNNNLTKANSINLMTRQITWIIGATISGFLYYYTGIVGVFLINGISFVLSGISELFIKITSDNNENINAKKSSFWKDFKEGIVFIKKQRLIMVLTVFILVINFLFNPILQIIFPKVLKFTLNVGVRGFGIFEAVFSLGSIIGLIVVYFLPKEKKLYKLVLLTLIIQCIIFTMFGVPILPKIHKYLNNNIIYILYCVFAFIMMIANSLIIVPVFTAMQKKIPDDFRGRYFGMFNTLTNGIVPLGLLLIGTISDIIHPSYILITAGFIQLGFSIWLIFVRVIKEI